MKNIKKLAIAAIVILGLLYLAHQLGVVNAQEAPAKAAFDHSNCQYPDRWSNPADGCDNSDPAVPECIKASSTEQGEKDCIAQFVAAQKSPAVTTPVTTSSPEHQNAVENNRLDYPESSIVGK